MGLKKAMASHLQQAIDGSEYHLSKLLQTVHPYLIVYIKSLGGTHFREAEDIAQMALIKLHRIFDRGDITNGGGMHKYVYLVAKHEYLNWYRLTFMTKRKNIRGGMMLLTDLDYPEDRDRLLGVSHDPTTITDVDRMDVVREIVGEMGQKYQRIFQLRYVEKKKYREVAKEMNMPLNSVRTALYRIKMLCTGVVNTNPKYQDLIYAT